MKKVVIGLVAVAVLAAGWFFASPLFIDRVVDEDFLADVSSMSEDERQKMKPQIMQAAANAPDRSSDEAMPAQAPILLSSGNFVDADAVHKGSGSASVYQLVDDRHVVRFENFRTTNGPALVVYLARHPSPASASDVTDNGFLKLGELKGNVGNQNYPVPDGTNIDEYGSVVIWCELFGVLFSPAPLEPENT